MNNAGKSRTTAIQSQRVFDFYLLEDRILLSGEGIEGADVAPDADLSDALMAELAEAEGQAVDDRAVAAALNSLGDALPAQQDVADAPSFDPALPLEVVFVDAGVDDAQTLLDGLRGGGEDQTQWLIVELDSNEDGVQQITDAFSELSGVDAIHIVSHGDGQGIQLGNARLDVDAAAGYAGDIASWASSLDADADLLIYGCDLASTADGRALIASIGALCDCDVAASADSTGHETFGGDWELEYTLGSVESSIAFSLDAQHDWLGLLETGDAQTSEDDSELSFELADLPLAFEENTGQTDAAVDYIARGGGYSVFLTEGDAVIDIHDGDSQYVVRLDLIGANANPVVSGEEALTSRSNYLVGDQENWEVGVANYTSVRYESVYDGVGLRYYGNQRQLEYDFIVDADTDTSVIRLNFDGVTGISVTETGELQLTLSDTGDFITFKAPVSYQLADDGSRIAVESSYLIHEDGTIGFALGDYDTSRELVIDPILDYTTFVGGTGYDTVEGIAADDSGNVYITGWTASTDFPTTVGAYDETYGGGSYDIYVAKLSSDGSSLVYSTFIGGSANDTSNSIAVDSSGNVYVAGNSGSADLPTVNAYQNTLSGTSDAVLIKLNSTGDTILYSSYLGGSGTETAYDLVLDSSDIVHVVGSTNSTDLPTKIPYDSTLGGGTDGFLAKFDLTQTGATSLLYSSYFGGSGDGYIKSVDIDSAGNIYVAGQTNSTDLTTVNAYQASNGGNYDVFAAKFSSDGSSLLYSTYLGGGVADYAEAIAVDDSGSMYLGGRTSGSFVTTVGAYDTTHGGSADGFVTKIDSTQSGAASLIYSTYLGNSGFDYVIGLDIDDSGNAYLAGFTGSSSFPTTIDGNDRIMTGANDGFFAVLNAAGTSLTYSTFIGGTGQDRAKDVDWNSATGAAYVGGQNEFQDGPTSPTPTSIGPGGVKDAYVAKFSFSQAADVTFTIGSTPSISEELSETANFTVTLGGDALFGGTTASVDINASGSALSGTDYDNFVTAVTTAAGATAGVTFDAVDTLTFDSSFNGGTGTGTFAFTVDAIDDASEEGTESIVATLSSASVSSGTASFGTFSDSFTEASNTNITAHTPDSGVSWTQYFNDSTYGEAFIDATLDVVQGGSGASQNDTGQAYQAGPDPIGVDQKIGFTLSAIETDSGTKPVGIFGRSTDINNFYYLRVLPNGNAQDSVSLWKMVGGVPTQLGSIDINIAAGDRFELEITDGTKKAFHNGTEVLSSNDNSLTAAGTWGFFLGDFNGVGGHYRTTWNIDDFLAEDYSSVVTASTDITETDTNNAPVINSNGGGPTAAINVAENTTAVTTVSATDADLDTLTYSIIGGADAANFSINSSSGALTFITPPNVESPTDIGANNVYDLIVEASDGILTDTQAVAVTVTDVDEFDVSTVTDTDATVNAVNENATVGTIVGIDAFASDADATNNTVTYSLQDSDGARFTINAATGVVKVNTTINRELVGASRNITVRATSSDTSFTDQVFAIAINDVDEFDITATSDADLTANAVDENATIGTVVGVTASASDADATDTITYSLDDNDGGRFAINSATGVVTVAGAIDRETDGATRSITVRSTSTDTSFTTQIFMININDLDEFDVGAVTDTDVAADAVNENATIGTVVGVTASASDLDATNNTITYSLFDDDGGRFAINSSTGVVTVNGAIDREADGASRNITVRATSSDTSFTDQVFAIAINDLDEFDVGVVTDTDGAGDAVNENATIGTAVGVTASAGDVDATNNTITYSLFDDDGGRFTINSSTGVVTVNGAIDREADGASRNITVRATSSDTSFTDQIFAIAINDLDEFDVGSVSDSDAATDEVNESAANGTAVGVTALATDADATDNTTYTLDDNVGDRFAINATTGVITVADNTLLDYETQTSHDVTVRATSDDASFSTAVFTFNVLDDTSESGASPISDTDAAADSLPENASIGSGVGITAFATDADITDTITYSLDDDAGGRFAIHATTGVVTLAGGIDAEAFTSHNITVRATSTDTSFSTAVFAISITDVDEFDVGPISDVDAATNSVAENSVIGTSVGFTASATDTDLTDLVTYSLDDSAGGRFAINSTTGVVTVAAGLDVESFTSHNIIVRATSDDASFSTAVYAINVTDVDEFDVGSVVDADLTANAVNENATIGTLVGVTAVASDADVTTNTITYSLQDNDGGRFAIDSVTGTVTVAGAIDRETDGPTRNITVRATSADSSFTDQVFAIAINDLDEFDVGPVSDTDVVGNAVNENATIGTAVGITASASDADATNNTITYSLFDNDGGRFAINSSTGVVTLAGALDRETDGPSRNITVRASSSDGSFTDQVFAIGINDVDEFDITSTTDSDLTLNAVDENAVVGTTVGVTASASDADATDTVTYSLDDNDGGRFAINSTTGVVTVVGGIDREADGATRSITVRSTSSDASFTSQIFVININDVDEFDVGGVSDGDAAANELDENAAIGTVVGITASAADADATNNTITYSLQDNDGGRFAINSSTGVVTVASAIDREADGPIRSITVRAASTDGSFTDQLFAIGINDVDEFDVGPVSDIDATSDSVNENAAIGTVVGFTASAADPDATNNAITFSLQDNDGGRFAIHSSTGVVTVAGAIDREADGASRNITVRAASSDGSFTDQVFAVGINDVDEFDVGAVVDTDATANAVNENATVGTIVGITGSASDADATNNAISYSLQDNDGGRFAINSSTGVVTVAGGIDREADGPSRNITVRATSSDSSFTDQVIAITINDLDEFDVGAVTDIDATANLVNENAVVGTMVGVTASASDIDATNNSITYSLTDNDGGRFAINSTTGVVTVAGPTDRETDGASRTITVRALSSDGSFTDQVVAINVGDVDEFDTTPTVDVDVTSNGIDENVAIGTTVGVTASASDADATNNTITYYLDDNDGGRFAINSSTGVVTVAGAIDREADGASRNITVRSTSSDSSFTTAIFAIAINDIDEFDVTLPVDNDIAANFVSENVSIGTTVGVTAFADDFDAGDTVSYSLDDNAGGRFAINSSAGLITVSGAIDYEASASHNVTVRATSTDGSSATQVFTINIGDVNEAPIANGDEYSVNAGDTLNVSVPGVLANDFDVDGDTMMAILVTPPTTGSATLLTDGTLIYTPDAGFFGTDTLQYQVTDGALLSGVVTVEITVNPGIPTGGSDPGDPGPDDEESDPPSVEPPGESESTDPPVDESTDPPVDPPATTTDPAAGLPPVGEAGLPDWIQVRPLPSVDAEETDAAEIDLIEKVSKLEATTVLPPSFSIELEMLERLLQVDLEQAIVWQQWDKMADEAADDVFFNQYMVGTAGATAGLFSVGYVLWGLRGGVFVTTLASSLPAWRMLDPATLLTAYRASKHKQADGIEVFLG